MLIPFGTRLPPSYSYRKGHGNFKIVVSRRSRFLFMSVTESIGLFQRVRTFHEQESEITNIRFAVKCCQTLGITGIRRPCQENL